MSKYNWFILGFLLGGILGIVIHALGIAKLFIG